MLVNCASQVQPSSPGRSSTGRPSRPAASFTRRQPTPAAPLRFSVFDGADFAAASNTLSFDITSANDAPTGAPTATLANDTEDTAYIVTAAELLAGFVEPDNGDVLRVANLVVSLGTVTPTADGSSFTITPAADYAGEVTISYDVIDGNGGTLAGQTRSFSIAAANDAAVIGGGRTGSVSEDGTLVADGALTITDADVGEAVFVAASNLDGNFCRLIIDSAGAWTYTLDNSSASLQALKAGETLNDTIIVASADGTMAQITVTISGADEAICNGASGGSLTGTAGAEIFTPGGGGDRVRAGNGNDKIIAEAGDGDEVKAGDLLMRLDQTQTRASLAVVVSQLDEMIARRARLEAVRDATDKLVFPDGFRQRSIENAALATGAERLYTAEREARRSQASQLEERLKQLDQEVIGLDQQSKSKAREHALIADQLRQQRPLFKRKLVSALRLFEVERDEQRLNSEIADFKARIARLAGQQSETRLRIEELDKQAVADALKELAEVNGQISELTERRIAGEDQLKRVDLLSPQDGFVHQLAVHTIGGGVGPGEVVMSIVPKNAPLSIEIKVAPSDIDQLAIGQPVTLRFVAFNQRTTLEVVGSIMRISADVSQDQRSGAEYYIVIVDPDPQSLKGLGTRKLLPGMPVESFIQTNSRKAISYFPKPFTDQLNRAFRED